jgi:putative ABC transport system permease protein
MLKNYIKIAWRNLLKNKVSSFINVGGLAAGMAVAMLIGLWIYDELSFNKYHHNYDRIGQVLKHNGTEDIHQTYTALPMPAAKELRNNFAGDFKYVVLAVRTSAILAYGENKFNQNGYYMEDGGLDLFSFKMLKGSLNGLSNPNSVFISESLTKKLFGDQDPVNKIIKLGASHTVKVAGVYEDLPVNSKFNGVSYLGSWDLMMETIDWARDLENNWNDNSFEVFVQLSPNADFEKVSAKIKGLERKFVNPDRLKYNPELFVHPMSNWHLYSNFENRKIAASEQLKLVWFYATIGLFVLLLACINFMNLSTARSEKRAKEVGIRKAIGSERGQLITQFFCESLLTAGLSFILAIILVQLTLPWFNTVAGKAIDIPYLNGSFWISGILFSIITGVLAGSYPALYLSSFKPIKVLKGVFQAGQFASVPRKVLVVFQFTVSIVLIIGTIIVFRQIEFGMSRPVGYSQQGLIQILKSSDDFNGKQEVLENELKATGAVSETAASSMQVTGAFSNTGGLEWKGKSPALEDDFAVVRITQNYINTIGSKLMNGRSFSAQLASDSAGLIINETAAKYMGFKDPIGQTIKWDFAKGDNKNFKIIGVVKDMVMNSPFEPVKQTLFVLEKEPRWMIMRINPNSSLTAAIPNIEAVFKKIVPAAPFDYKFVTDNYANKFAAEQRIGKLATFFAILAIMISCLGLFGLASFVAEQRTKEIGIRKVLGASVANLWQMLSKDFVVLVLISCLIAVPLANYFMSEWLAKYQYRSEISWWIFIAACVGALTVTLLTVSFQAIRAALANPVKSLRSE